MPRNNKKKNKVVIRRIIDYVSTKAIEIHLQAHASVIEKCISDAKANNHGIHGFCSLTWKDCFNFDFVQLGIVQTAPDELPIVISPSALYVCRSHTNLKKGYLQNYWHRVTVNIFTWLNLKMFF